MKDFVAALFNDAPKDLVDQGKKANAAFQKLTAAEDAAGDAEHALDVAKAEFKYEQRLYHRLVNQYAPQTTAGVSSVQTT